MILVFSGPKTAVLRAAQAMCGQDFSFPSYKLPERLTDQQVADIAASFQRVACETIVEKAALACQEFEPVSVVIAGGVAANQRAAQAVNRGAALAYYLPRPYTMYR